MARATQLINIATGTTNTVSAALTADTVITWQSAATGAKSQTIPTAIGSGFRMTVTDCQGTATTYPITVAPATGSVIGASMGTNHIYTNYSSITLIDTSIGWVAI
jgi:hypothetical protein